MVTPEETEKLYDLAAQNTNQQQTPQQRATSIAYWKRYTADLNYEDVRHAIDAHNMANRWPPKPAELRTRILAPDLPTPEQAVIQARQLTQAIEAGLRIPKTHPLVSETLQQTGTVHDLDFKAIYAENRAAWIADNLTP